MIDATQATTLDFGRSSAKSARFDNERQNLAKLLTKEDNAPEQETPTAPVVVEQAPKNVPLSQEAALAALGLSLQQGTVEFVFPVEQENYLRIKVQILAITTTEDSISILIPGAVELTPPRLVQFSLKIDSVRHPVVYAGGVLRLGSMQMLSFVRPA
jgi:hypothetical protein